MSQDDLAAVDARWDSLFLVCKDCRRRKNGPRHVKPKALAKELKREASHNSVGKVRVVLTSCLSLCPKRATSVGFVGTDGAWRIVAVESDAQLAGVPHLLEEPSDSL